MSSSKQSYYVLQKLDPIQHTIIIRGDFHQGDKRFVELSRDKQCVAVSIAALCFFKIEKNPASWKTVDINNILINGDIQYHASYKKMKHEGKTPQGKHLSISEVYPYAKIGRRYFCFNEMNNVSNVGKDVLDLNNLERSLNRFFNENQCGIFTCNIYSFALMRKPNSFFLFNSFATSYDGESMNPNDEGSSACLMEMFTIKCLANYLLVACTKQEMIVDDSEHDTTSYTLTNISIEKKVFGKNILQREKVHRDLCLAERNRGGVKRKHKSKAVEDEEYNINRQLEVMTKKMKYSVEHQSLMQNDLLEQVTFDSSDKIGGNNKSINTDYEFDDVSTISEVVIGCGLVNLGNSCFFNACLQALFHIPTINIHLQKIKTKKCACVVCNIITAYKDTHTQKNERQYYYNPAKLYVALLEGNKDLLNGQQQDAHEFWVRIMELIGSKENCSTKFDRLFVHDIVTIVNCGYCHRNFKTERKCLGHVIDIRGRLTIREALDVYFAEDVLEKYKCDACKRINNGRATKKYIFKSAPKILCLVLNRFETKNVKIKDNVALNEQLNLSVSNETNEVHYKLVSIINHFGSNISNGHYTAIACGSNNSFYEFDDRFVHNVSTIIGSNAYILMYELSTEIETADTNNFEPDHADNQYDVQSIFNEMQDETSPNNFNFDKLIDIDDGFEENTDAEDIHRNELMSPHSCDVTENRNESALQDESENREVESQKNPFGGHRIVDIGFLFEQMKYINRHSDECCSQMVFRKETKMGFRSIFHFECSECGVFHRIQSSSKNIDYMNVNKAATLGITSTGSGFNHLEEFCAHMNIPCMSSNTFDKENKKIQKDWSDLSKHHTEKALLEEIKLARARGDIDSAGNPLIPIICDGSWGKRSYGKGFSSLSGSAAIIGLHTKKVIYFGVKNKYCHICTLSYANFCPPNDHKCNISYVGPSSGMETEILVEGFLFCQTFGARFHKVISDGDSSAFKEITERCVYQNPDIVIEKIECVNHLYKNARKKLTALCTDTGFKLTHRKLLKGSMGDDLCKGVRSAAKHWRESNLDIMQKRENLENDCLNAPLHYFGNHDNCDKYFCKKTTTSESSARIAELKSCGLFHEIMNYCNVYFASNVTSLLEDETNNPAEELNNVIAKYLGGKRINYSLAGSYTGRVSAAVVQYNSKGHAGSQFHKFYSISPNNYCLKMENARIKHYVQNEIARQANPRKRAIKDKDVKGYKAQTEDLSEHALQVAMNIELDKMNAKRIDRDMILTSTMGQKHNQKWKEMRKKLINCNYFGRIVNARGPKSYQKLLEEMLYSPIESGNTAEVRHQRLYELDALKMFHLVHNDFQLEKTGIFIDQDLCFLGASPLRLFGPNSIVNIKCPVKAFRKTIDYAISKIKKTDFPLYYKDGEIDIIEKSNWYVEVQGQLHVTGRQFCYVLVWLGTEFIIKKIAVDHSFWNNKMKNKLEFFFNEAMLKELANSRRGRKMPLRKYDLQTKKFI